MKQFFLILALFMFIAMPAPLYADSTTAQDVAAAEKYLNNLHTLKARFIQTSSDGTRVAGDFLLKRPGRMKFTYDPPIEDFIVADGIFVYYYDGALKEQSSAPISQSLADFFLRKEVTLNGDLQVTETRHESGLALINIVQKAEPEAGSLTLAFDENTFQLKKWRVTDPQGIITEVELFDTVEGIKLNNDTFHYYNPHRINPKLNK